MAQVTKAVIPVAGFGTRFLPFTKAVPKAMLPVVNRPAVEIIIDEAYMSGIKEIALIVGQNKEVLQAHFGDNEVLNNALLKGGKTDFYQAVNKYKDLKISFIEQTEQKGTAHAISLAKDFVDGQPFAVMFGDDLMYNKVPVIKQLIDAYSQKQATVIGCKRVPFDQVSKYATVEYESEENNLYKISKIIEKPKKEEIKSNLSPLGRYVCSNEIFDIIQALKPGKNGEYQFTDALDVISREMGGYALEFEGIRYDMGDRLGFLKANVEFALRDESLKGEFENYLKEILNKR